MIDNRLFHAQRPLLPVGNVNGLPMVPAPKTPEVNFDQVLYEKMSGILGLKFSNHACQRLASRNISFGPAEITKLSQAVAKAESKGAKESLILFDNSLAFVVSIKNKTVITAMDSASIKDNVFTNIDSAVIV